MKILKRNKKLLVSEELINKKNQFLFSCGPFRIFYSTFTKRSDLKKNAAYLHNHTFSKEIYYIFIMPREVYTK